MCVCVCLRVCFRTFALCGGEIVYIKNKAGLQIFRKNIMREGWLPSLNIHTRNNYYYGL